MVGPESSEKGPLKDRDGRSHGQFFGFGPISVCGQKLTMGARVNLKSVTKHPKGNHRLKMAKIDHGTPVDGR
jgi:hypothetical protein